jgi:small-conductance mechanosensitive channel
VMQAFSFSRWSSKRFASFIALVCGCALLLGSGSANWIGGGDVIKYLDWSIDWYQGVRALNQTAVDSQEMLYRDGANENARQAMKLAFDFARAQAAIIENQGPQAASTSAPAVTAAHLKQLAAAAEQRVADLKRELNASSQTAKTATDLARQSKLSAELDLASTRRDVLTQYSGFMTSAVNGTATLGDKIDQLERTLPELQIDATADATKSTSAAAAANVTANSPQFRPESAGIITLISELFSLNGRLSEVARLKQEALDLQEECDHMRAPLRAEVIDDLHRGNTLGAATQDSGDESTDVAKLQADRQTLEALTADFKFATAAAVPLSEQSTLLAAAAESLGSWHSVLEREYALAVRSLLLRTLVTALVVIVLVVISELWRRATFHYVSDARRRRQLMFIRRIVIGIIVLLIIIGSVVTEFGSLATFAGLITAGIAVALQTVILSGVAYFFFIGRFGVRVGDRVTVSGITGDVVEIGLFRLYLMELAGPITDLHSTGRMIVFSNAVLFQPSAFYKQLPGTEYVWHEVALTMSPETDHALAEKRLMAAVESVFSQYREAIEKQRDAANDILHVALEAPQPKVRLRFVDAGLEMVIRYPVELKKASAFEDQITRKLLEAIQQEPKLKMVASGTPKIQAAK